jgi:hypothetical protein
LLQIMPQDSENQLVSMVPRLNQIVTVKIGDPVEVSDLVAAYHASAAKRAEQRARNRGVSGATPPHHVVHMLSADGSRVDTRVENGVTIAAYVERPLLIKPPDHATLSPAEAVIEEKFRLQLYADITQRLHAAMCQLERELRQYRKEKLGLGDLDDKQR